MSECLVAACGGDTVKLFDISSESSSSSSCDRSCILSYTPSPGFQINCVKWNHTNLVVASAGDDKRISLWRKNGQSLGTIPVAGSVAGNNIEESISAINFSNKNSRYICSGGSSQIVRIWDLQQKRCIKWLKGHTDTISGTIYNCKDEHLASVSINGSLIIHNLASGSKTSELRDPNHQVLRLLDYSRTSRHRLVTAGDDGSVHVWDTTGRSPKVSWLKQHSAPTSGLCFSPSNDKIIASVGLDKKLFTFDSGSRRPAFSTLYESPFSALAFADDGLKLAAGTSSGRIVVYDVRRKTQPLAVFNAYGSVKKVITSLCWPRSKPIVVKDSNCTDEMALFGGATEGSIVIPDPLPSVTSSRLQRSMVPQVRKASRFGPSVDTTSTHSDLPTGTNLRRLRAGHDYTRDDMDVFSPVVEVQPFSPSMWDAHGALKKNFNLKSLLFPSQRFNPLEDHENDAHPAFNWKPGLTSEHDDVHSSQSHVASTPSTSSKSDDTNSVFAPESWGDMRVSDKFSGAHVIESTSQTINCLSGTGLILSNWQAKELKNQATSLGPAENISSSSKYLPSQIDLDSLGTALSMPHRLWDGTNLSVGSPKNKKTGLETKEEILSGLFSRPNMSSAIEAKDPPPMNGSVEASSQHDSPHGSSFTLQLFQQTIEDTLSSFQKSIRDDTRNLHIEILRQSNMQEIEMSSAMNVILSNQSELMKEVQSLRKEMEQLRQLL